MTQRTFSIVFTLMYVILASLTTPEIDAMFITLMIPGTFAAACLSKLVPIWIEDKTAELEALYGIVRS